MAAELSRASSSGMGVVLQAMLDAEAPSVVDKDIAQALAATYLGDDESRLLSLLPTPEAKRSLVDWLRGIAESLRVHADGEELAAVPSVDNEPEEPEAAPTE